MMRSPIDPAQVSVGILMLGSLGQTVAPVTPRILEVQCEEMPELQHLKKFMEEIDTTEVRQTLMITSEL